MTRSENKRILLKPTTIDNLPMIIKIEKDNSDFVGQYDSIFN